MRAVPVVILWIGIIIVIITARHNLARKLQIGQVHPCINDCNHNRAGAGGDVPRLGCPHVVRAPLFGVVGVVRDGLKGAPHIIRLRILHQRRSLQQLRCAHHILARHIHHTHAQRGNLAHRLRARAAQQACARLAAGTRHKLHQQAPGHTLAAHIAGCSRTLPAAHGLRFQRHIERAGVAAHRSRSGQRRQRCGCSWIWSWSFSWRRGGAVCSGRCCGGHAGCQRGCRCEGGCQREGGCRRERGGGGVRQLGTGCGQRSRRRLQQNRCSYKSRQAHPQISTHENLPERNLLKTRLQKHAQPCFAYTVTSYIPAIVQHPAATTKPRRHRISRRGARAKWHPHAP